MTLDVAGASWTVVIEEIAKKTGVEFHYLDAPEGVVTVSCPRMAVARVIECLLGGRAAWVLRYPPGTVHSIEDPMPTDVWILWRGATGRNAGRSQCPRGRCAMVDPRVDPGETKREKRAVAREDEIGALLQMAHADNPEARRQALGRLATRAMAGDPAERMAFRAALMDKDASVRAEAVFDLTRVGGAEAVPILQQALHDRDASVRLMAVDGAGADPQGVALLQEALVDSDETVRRLAATKLGQTGYAARAPR
jgi:hypothetical protein